MNRMFIDTREVLLAIEGTPKGSYFSESAFIGSTFATPADALFHEGKARFGDEVLQFFRFDLDALHGEDITEQMASAFLDDFDRTPEDEDMLPTFVRTSDAWESWVEAYRIENGFGHNSAARLQRHYGTYNARQQGLVAGAVL